MNNTIKIRLIHWNQKEAEKRASILQQKGYRVTWDVPRIQQFFREIKAHPPAAFLIDLARMPSQGRDVALTLRKTRATRFIPLLFINGKEEKIEKIRKLLPDAFYSDWSTILTDLKSALEHPIENPIVPRSIFAPYAGRPLSKKLGIKTGEDILLVNPPRNIRQTLKPIPDNVHLHRDTTQPRDLVLWFVRSRLDLQREIQSICKLVTGIPLWIIWPKRGSFRASDLSQTVVRKTGLANGLVDYKICSVDKTWSGLLFKKRSSK